MAGEWDVVAAHVGVQALARVGARTGLAHLRRGGERRFRALIDAGFDVVYRMSPDWTRMHALDGRGLIADTERPSDTWLDTYIDATDQPEALTRPTTGPEDVRVEPKSALVASVGATH